MGAYGWLKTLLAELPEGHERVAFVQGKVDELEPRVPRINLNDVPAGAVVEIDGKKIDGDVQRVNPGEHEVLVTTAAGSSKRYTVDLEEGETRELELGSEADTEPTSEAGTEPSSDHATLRTAGWVLGGIGAVGVVIATLSWFSYNSIENEREGICPSQRNCTTGEITRDAELESDASSAGTRAAIGLVGGALALGAGITILVVTDGDQEVQAGPTVSSTGAGFRVGGVW